MMPRVYTKKDSKIIVSAGEPFTIQLEGNPTTGYEWELQVDNDKLQVIDQQFQAPGTTNVGGGGQEQFTLKPVKKGAATVRALYKRAWEREPIEEKKFIVEIK